MYEVVSNVIIAPSIHRIEVLAPRIAAARQPGQFVIVRCSEGGERIPLTIADANTETGTITLMIQAIGEGTAKLAKIQPPDGIRDVAGPLGMPTEIENVGKVVCVGGGVGTAVLFPLAKALADAGNQVTTIIGGRSEQFVILRDELAEFCDEVIVTTEDGSLGEKGFVTIPLGEIIKDPDRRPEAIYAIGPVPMMSAITEQTRRDKIRTIVSLNPIMVDGTGMCGGCRVTVDGEVKFACVDGPEFDGHLVDFRELATRQQAYCDDQHCRMTDAMEDEA